MGSIIESTNTTALSKLKDKKLILVGGCFDILHAAHIEFLNRAKKLGGKLIILLEDDARISKLKGKNRPINSQIDRATVLANLSMVDYVIPLKNMNSDKDYETLVKMLEPAIIAITHGSPVYEWEKKYVENTSSTIVEVMERKHNYSTTRLAQKIKL